MPDENQEEVEPQTNPTPEEEPKEETPIEPEAALEPQEESKEAPKSDEPSEKEKRLYARLKKEEDKAKKLEQELQGAKKKADPTDVDKILSITAATKGFNTEEIAELQLRAAATGKSLLEARSDENFKLWRKAHKQKVEEEKIPSPSTRQNTAEKEVKSFDSLTPVEQTEFLENMSDDETEEWLDGLTVGGVKIEDMKGIGGLGISQKGIEAFKKEKMPRPMEERNTPLNR